MYNHTPYKGCNSPPYRYNHKPFRSIRAHTHMHTPVHMHRYRFAYHAREASGQLFSVCSCLFTFSRQGLSCFAAALWVVWSKSFCQFLSLSLLFLQECMGSRRMSPHPASHWAPESTLRSYGLGAPSYPLSHPDFTSMLTFKSILRVHWTTYLIHIIYNTWIINTITCWHHYQLLLN